MKTSSIIVMVFGLIATSVLGAEKKQDTADHLQNVSVTIRSEGEWSNGEGSGVIFTRKDADGNQVNFVWTAAHVIDNLRSTRKVVVDGAPKTLVEFKDPMVVKEIRQNGRTVGRLQMDAEVLKYSDADDGHDLALLRVRKLNFVTDTVTFHLNGEILNPEKNIIIVAFVDLNCAYCKKSDYEIRKILKLNKDINYIIKHFPILGESSMLAARASISIRLEEDFNVYLKFYNNLMMSKSKLSLTEIERIAVNSGANTDIMIRTLYTNKVDEIINANYKVGEMLGIAGTPTFIINGEIYRGHLEGYELEEIINTYRKRIQKKQS